MLWIRQLAKLFEISFEKNIHHLISHHLSLLKVIPAPVNPILFERIMPEFSGQLVHSMVQKPGKIVQCGLSVIMTMNLGSYLKPFRGGRDGLETFFWIKFKVVAKIDKWDDGGSFKMTYLPLLPDDVFGQMAE